MRLGEFDANVLESMKHLLIVILAMVLENIQVSGEVMELDLTQVLQNGNRGSVISPFQYQVVLSHSHSNI